MLLLFDAARDAINYALAYQKAMNELAPPLKARAGLHVGNVTLRGYSPADVALGAKPNEVEGVAKVIAARVMSIALGGQILLSSDARRDLTLVERRAEAAEPDFQPTVEDREAIAHLVALLDGLPLGIELAAAGVRALPSRTLLMRMSERFKLLASKGGRHDRESTAASGIRLVLGPAVLCREGGTGTTVGLRGRPDKLYPTARVDQAREHGPSRGSDLNVIAANSEQQVIERVKYHLELPGRTPR